MNAPIDISKIADAQEVAQKLSGLSKDALIYIAGFVDGCHGHSQKRRKRPSKSEKAN